MLIDGLAAGLEASGYRDGCPIATVTLEAAGPRAGPARPPSGSSTPGSGRSRRASLAEGMDRRAAARRALLVLSAIEGALLLARARRDLAPLEAVREELWRSRLSRRAVADGPQAGPRAAASAAATVRRWSAGTVQMCRTPPRSTGPGSSSRLSGPQKRTPRPRRLGADAPRCPRPCRRRGRA